MDFLEVPFLAWSKDEANTCKLGVAMAGEAADVGRSRRKAARALGRGARKELILGWRQSGRSPHMQPKCYKSHRLI